VKDKPVYGEPPAHERVGDLYPREPRSGEGRNWTGWLTHREYDVLDAHIRMDINNIYWFMSPKRSVLGCEKMFSVLSNLGLIDGECSQFYVTAIGHQLHHLTDQYMLNYDCGEEAA